MPTNGAWLVAHIPLDKAMLQKWLTAGFVEKQRLYPTEAGVPQGGICSPVIANLTLDGLEQLLRVHYPSEYQASPTRQGEPREVLR